jgi:hypothetical protein
MDAEIIDSVHEINGPIFYYLTLFRYMEKD